MIREEYIEEIKKHILSARIEKVYNADLVVKNNGENSLIFPSFNQIIEYANKASNVDKFFEVVDSCEGKVELITGEGDRLNLKSKLCQFMSMTQIFSRADELHLEIVASEEEDLQKICKYLMKYEDM